MMNSLPSLGFVALLSLFLFSCTSLALSNNLGLHGVGLSVRNATEAALFFSHVFDCTFEWELKHKATPSANERSWADIFQLQADAFLPHFMCVDVTTVVH